MIDKLELLLALAKARHFGKAAEAAGVSQPTLSSAVKSLEDQLGVLIVERGSRFKGFTPEGERVLDWARRLVGDQRTMRQEIEALRRGVGGHLRIGVIPTALPFVTTLSVPYRTRHASVRLSVISRNSADILAGMRNFELDLGISYIDNEPVGAFKTLPLYEEHYALLVSPKSPLARKTAITWKEAGELPLCLLTPDMQNRRLIDRHLADAGIEAKPTLDSNSMLLLYTHVLTGEWVSIIPSRLVEALDHPGGLVSIPLVEPSVTHEIGLVFPDRDPQTPIVSAFLELARTMSGKGRDRVRKSN